MPMKNQIEIEIIFASAIEQGIRFQKVRYQEICYQEICYQKIMFSMKKTTVTTAAQKSGF